MMLAKREVHIFYTHGAVDGSWDKGSIWNMRLVKLQEVPEDGVYKYTASQEPERF